MWWVFANYGRTEDMPLQGIFKVVADSEADARLQVEKFLMDEGHKFCKITEVTRVVDRND